MVVQAPIGQLPRSSDVADFYHRALMVNEEHGPSAANALVNLATATGSDRKTMDALTKAFAGLTAFTQSQAGELGRLTGVETLAGIAPPTHVVPVITTVVRGNGRAHAFK
jgi:hypothetical protein